MPYVKTEWKDRIVENPLTFNLQNNPDGTVTLIPAEGQIIDPGTPITANNMNNLEKQYEEIEKLAQLTKITNDTGGVKLSVTSTAGDILADVVAAGRGFHTFYAISNSKNMPPGGRSIRGHAFFTDANYGFIWATDYANQIFTNYYDNGRWLGWSVISGDNAGWTTIALQNGVQIYGAEATALQYKIFGNILYLRGTLKNIMAASTTVATLPAGARPITSSHSFTMPTSVTGGDYGRVARWTIGTDGRINMEGNTGQIYNSAFWYPIMTSFPLS